VKDLPVSGSLRFLADSERIVVTVLVPKAAKEEEVAEEAPAEAEATESAKEKAEE